MLFGDNKIVSFWPRKTLLFSGFSLSWCFLVLARRANLELFQAKHVMSATPITLSTVEPVQRLAALLLETEHGGFPVTRRAAAATGGQHRADGAAGDRATGDGDEVAYGFINRSVIRNDHWTESMRSKAQTQVRFRRFVGGSTNVGPPPHSCLCVVQASAFESLWVSQNNAVGSV